MRRAALLPALVMLPWRRLGPEECSPGTRPTIGHELARVCEAQEVLQLGHQRHGRDQLHAAQGLQRLHQRRQRPLGQRVAHRLLEPRDARRRLR